MLVYFYNDYFTWSGTMVASYVLRCRACTYITSSYAE